MRRILESFDCRRCCFRNEFTHGMIEDDAPLPDPPNRLEPCPGCKNPTAFGVFVDIPWRVLPPPSSAGPVAAVPEAKAEGLPGQLSDPVVQLEVLRPAPKNPKPARRSRKPAAAAPRSDPGGLF